MRPMSVTVRPSGAALVRYAVELDMPDATVVRETLVAATGSLLPRGAAVVEGDIDARRVAVGLWRWPNDPALPALPRLLDLHRLRSLLASAGVSGEHPPTVRVLSYRPTRRAVLEITAGEQRLFAKVVTPSQLPGLRDRHDLLVPCLPVPRLLITTDDGLALMPALPGSSARTALRLRDPLPGPAMLEDVLDRLPAALTGLPRRSDHRRSAHHYGAVLAMTVPEEGHRVTTLADAIADADVGEHPIVPTHGDFYEHQLLTSGGQVTGLLDIDTAGPGHRLDDWANLLAHLSVTGTPQARRWRSEILWHVRDRFRMDDLCPRVASTLLGLATGPFRTQRAGWRERTRQRIDLAEHWLTSP